MEPQTPQTPNQNFSRFTDKCWGFDDNLSCLAGLSCIRCLFRVCVCCVRWSRMLQSIIHHNIIWQHFLDVLVSMNPSSHVVSGSCVMFAYAVSDDHGCFNFSSITVLSGLYKCMDKSIPSWYPSIMFARGVSDEHGWFNLSSITFLSDILCQKNIMRNCFHDNWAVVIISYTALSPGLHIFGLSWLRLVSD